MTELDSKFSSLPADYQNVLGLAQDKHNIRVKPLQEIKGGRTGAYLYLTSVSSPVSKDVQHLILKLDHKNKKAKLDERERHKIAVSQAPAGFAQNHIASLAFDRVEFNEAIAIFYGVAGHSLHNYQPLSGYQQQNKLEKIFMMTSKLLISEWNNELIFEQAVSPWQLLDSWLGYRLQPGSNIENFLNDVCHIPHTTPGLIIQNNIFPNPLVYARTSQLWGNVRPIDTIVGFQHGDLNIGNILARFNENEADLDGYYLIDFALFKPQMPLLYDHCYLEISYLIRELNRVSFSSWVDLVKRFAEKDIIDIQQIPIELTGACAVIASGRRVFADWLKASHPSLSDDLWGQFWLAAVAAGLNYCNKSAITEKERLAGLIFAAAHMKRYHAMFGVSHPIEVKHIELDDFAVKKSSVNTKTAVAKGPIQHNLPAQPTPFIGRQNEISKTRQLLHREDVRLLTLTGPGGTGKTRLALQAVSDIQNGFSDGIYFVDIAPIRKPESVLAAIARTVGVRETSDRSLPEELKTQLQAKKLLLLLDNFEQVTAAGPNIHELLQDCPQVKVLVTSREALHVRDEHVYPVPPLALPGEDLGQHSIEQLTQFEGVRLFIERAAAIKPDFELTEKNAHTVAGICARLDGLPLAIELAAARIILFSPQALLERVSSRLKLLRGGAKDLPLRQQTLRDTIDWSYEILDENEQRLFSLLSVFTSCTFDAVEKVASNISLLNDTGIDIVEGVISLIDKSLVRRTDNESGEPRLYMLETIREYAIEKLAENPEFTSDARKAHAAYFSEFTQKQYSRLTGNQRDSALQEIEFEIENMRSSWHYWVSEKDIDQLNKLTNCLWLLYDARGWYHSTLELTTDLLNVLASIPSTPERAQQEITLRTSLARVLMAVKGCTPEVEEAYTAALELCQKYGEIPQSLPVLRSLASFYVYVADFEKSKRFGKQILDLAEQLDNVNMRAEGNLIYGYSIAFSGNIIKGLEYLEQGIAGYDPELPGSHSYRFGNNPGVTSHITSAMFMWMLGALDRSHEQGEKAIALANKLNHPFSISYALFHTGLLHFWMQEYKIAAEHAQTVLEIAGKHEFQIWKAIAICLNGSAISAMGRAQDGLTEIKLGLEMYTELKTPPVFWPLLLLLQAGAYVHANQPEKGLSIIHNALQIFGPESGNPLMSELIRLKGDVLLIVSQEKRKESELLFRKAAKIASGQQTLLLELRAHMSLYRLQKGTNNSEEYRQMLNETYSKFTEGFESADLKEARELLDILS